MLTFLVRIFFVKKNIEAILISQKDVNHWWHTEEIFKVADIVNKIKKQSDKKVVLYGASMGGYAAVHYRNIFDAELSIAIAPQIFIDKSVAYYENRWQKELDALQGKMIFNEVDNIREQEGVIYILYDPIHIMDNKHIISYQDLIDNSTAKFIEVPYSGHDLARFLNSTGVLKSIVIQIYEDGKMSNNLLSKFSELYLDDHKAFFNYFRKASLSSEKQNKFLLETMEKHLKDLEKMDFEALYMVAETLSNFGRYEEAINISKRSIDIYKTKMLKDAPSYLYGKYELILKKSKSGL